MDVIVEGHINEEEPMADVIATVVALKSCQTPILRINEDGSDMQGRLLFSQGGYIVGAKINVSGETGWDAVRKLLNVTNGNYAILDPVRKPTADLNQALWVPTEKIIPLLPNLPASGEQYVDKQPQRSQESAVRPKTGQTDLAPLMAAVGAPKDEEIFDPAIPNKVEKEERHTVEAKAPSRQYDQGRWRVVRFGLQLAFGVAVAGLIMWQSDNLWSWWWHHIWIKIMALFNIAV
ncbi:MAG: hypothetical protein KGS72_22315 [Cyanobacteria bacterium REEB67]|nr:hypothetical protein [Cyanobacteria bacterium REEB67]